MTKTPHRQTIPVRDISAPTSISAEAQASLTALAAMPRHPYPSPHDGEAWIAYAAQAEGGQGVGMFAGIEDVAVAEEVDLGGVRSYLARPLHGETREDRILYDLHGGALFMGGGRMCRLATMAASVMFGTQIYGVDYRMPPSHPYPVPLDDCLSGYRSLLDHYAPGQIVVRGISAGANLAAAMMLRARCDGLPFPAGLVLATPELDLSESGDSFVTLEDVDVVLKRSLMSANLLYANGHSLTDPNVSPLFGDFFAGFPPTLLTTGTRDLFLSNAVRMHNALRRSGNHSELLIEEAMPHWGFFGAPEDAVMATDIVDFAERAWEGQLGQ